MKNFLFKQILIWYIYVKGVFALNGLLYVVSQEDKSAICSTEIFDPKSNIWTMLTPNMNICDYDFGGAVVVNRYPFFKSSIL